MLQFIRRIVQDIRILRSTRVFLKLAEAECIAILNAEKLEYYFRCEADSTELSRYRYTICIADGGTYKQKQYHVCAESLVSLNQHVHVKLVFLYNFDELIENTQLFKAHKFLGRAINREQNSLSHTNPF